MDKSKRPPTLNNKLVEKQLTPRLKKMGYLLGIFAVCSLGYAIFDAQNIEAEEEVLIPPVFEHPTAPAVETITSLNYFAVAGVFTSVGLLLLFIAWKKKCRKKS